MSRKSEYNNRELVKSKIFQCIIYPDAENYDASAVIKSIQDISIQYAYILHNEDIMQAGDLFEEYNEKDYGKHKKDHIHCIFSFADPKQLGLVSKLIGLPSNYVQKVDNRVGAFQYLIHLNNPEKHQYNLEDIVTNIQNIRRKYFADSDTTMKAEKIVEFINHYDGYLTLTTLSKWCINELCWDELRRGQHIFTAILLEHNINYKE